MSLKTPNKPKGDFEFAPAPKPPPAPKPKESWVTIKPGIQQDQESGRMRQTPIERRG